MEPPKDFVFALVLGNNEAIGIAFDKEGNVEINWNSNQGEPMYIKAAPCGGDIPIPGVNLIPMPPMPSDGQVH